MPRSCVGRVAIVTGSSRGIGQAIACRLAAEGARVAILGRPGPSRNTELAGTLDETVALIDAAGGEPPLVVTADIGDPSFDKGIIVAEVRDAFGSAPDVLVNVAAAPREFGGGEPPIPFSDTPREWFFRSVEINVWAAWDLAKQVIPGMRERGAGWILSHFLRPGRAEAPADRPGRHEPSRRRLSLRRYQGVHRPSDDRRRPRALRRQHRRQQPGADRAGLDPVVSDGDTGPAAGGMGTDGDHGRGGVGSLHG